MQRILLPPMVCEKKRRYAILATDVSILRPTLSPLKVTA
jgi:hypothetical protein